MIPDSFRELEFEKSCANCRHLKEVPYKRDDLCCFGDIVEEDKGVSYLSINGIDVSISEGDEYSEIWGGRAIRCPLLSICDKWEKDEFWK